MCNAGNSCPGVYRGKYGSVGGIGNRVGGWEGGIVWERYKVSSIEDSMKEVRYG